MTNYFAYLNLKRLPALLVVFLLAVILPIVRAAWGFAQEPDRGDAIVSGSIADASTLIPILASDSASSEVCGLLYNGLVKYDKDLQLVGDLAESWEIQDEGLTIVFHLRRNVVWHDGRPFTARDVEFTYQKLIDPQVRTPYGGDFERVKALEVPDEFTVRVTYKEAFAPALSSWGMPILPRHVLEKEDLNTTRFARQPIGLGPYRFKSWKTQEKIELISNPAYFEHQPFIDRAIYRVIPDVSTIFLELQTQGLDSAGLTPLQFTRQTDTAFFKTHYRKFRLPSFTYVYLGYNLDHPFFRDKKVRQALNHAVDKDEIIRIVHLGLGTVCTGPFIPGSWAYNDRVKPAAFAPALARQLLAEAGWRDTDADGWLDKEGKPFSFTVITNQGNEERIRSAEIIQRRLKEIGVEMKIKVLEWSVFIHQFVNKRKFEAVILGWSLPREPDNFDIWHSSKTREGEFNFVGYSNPEVDTALVEARKIFDPEKRKIYYQRVHQLLYEDQPYMFLYVPDSLSVLHNRFRGVKPAPAGIGYNFIDWWVEKSRQRYRLTP
ncbi:MAG TPA: peptide-binding protein [Candidatus Omnitrophota bacterium]|nr:peptide-binding protein [Candidatus Omnitrophota bacterium]HRZ15680.1 peptide-binding protein [Candidatus Omnitrophota bacterium]